MLHSYICLHLEGIILGVKIISFVCVELLLLRGVKGYQFPMWVNLLISHSMEASWHFQAQISSSVERRSKETTSFCIRGEQIYCSENLIHCFFYGNNQKNKCWYELKNHLPVTTSASSELICMPPLFLMNSYTDPHCRKSLWTQRN